MYQAALYRIDVDWVALAALTETPYVDPMYVTLAMVLTLER